jgi:hypothetical protein
MRCVIRRLQLIAAGSGNYNLINNAGLRKAIQGPAAGRLAGAPEHLIKLNLMIIDGCTPRPL